VDKLDLIVAKIDDMKADLTKNVDQVQLDVDDIRSNQIEMSHDVRRNADDLEVHMKRTNINEKRLEHIENKLTIEYLLKLIITVAAGVGTISGSIYGAIKLLDYLTK